jgi:hypothetical protein
LNLSSLKHRHPGQHYSLPARVTSPSREGDVGKAWGAADRGNVEKVSAQHPKIANRKKLSFSVLPVTHLLRTRGFIFSWPCILESGFRLLRDAWSNSNPKGGLNATTSQNPHCQHVSFTSLARRGAADESGYGFQCRKACTFNTPPNAKS